MRSLPVLFLLLSSTSLASTHVVTYEIPVPEALEPFSRFEMEYSAQTFPDGMTEVSYKFPRFVLGSDKEFHFRGRVEFSARQFELIAEQANMRCVPGDSEALCKATFRNVEVDLKSIEEALEAMPITRAEKLGRFEVAARIARSGGDFAGVLKLVREPVYDVKSAAERSRGL